MLCDEEPDAGIVEGSLPAHLRHTDIAVPVGDWAVTRIGLEADALQSIRRWNEDGQRWAIQRNDVGAVERMVAWVVSSRPPRAEFGLECIIQRRRQSENRADIEVPVRPSIESLPNARRERVVDG